ncbi:hypothetical protein SM033_00194 [Vibrio phage vB_VpaM_sm033]|nr:hypothetical protein SM033_00194 [Vibrio phage vB_VpaM_sm033]
MGYVLLAVVCFVYLCYRIERRSMRIELNQEKTVLFSKLNTIQEARSWSPEKATQKIQGILAQENRTGLTSRLTTCVTDEEIHRVCHGNSCKV